MTLEQKKGEVEDKKKDSYSLLASPKIIQTPPIIIESKGDTNSIFPSPSPSTSSGTST